MFSSEQLEKIKRMVQDPEWNLIDKMLRDYIEPLNDINYIDLLDNATNVKAEIKSRKHFYTLIDKFLKDAQVLASGREIEAIDPRDTME